MKKKKGFVLREICGENILVAEGKENIDFSNIISMNESSSYLWTSIGDVDFSEEDLATKLEKEYEVDHDIALHDVKTLIKQWKDAGIIE
jgi:hypothetical protein